MITASYLFSKKSHVSGLEKCFFCGNDCGQDYLSKDYAKPTFTNRDIVRYPGSKYVCGCCIESMRTGGPDLSLIDGDVKTERAATPRFYSWVLEDWRTRAFSKRHLDFAREILKRPPDPPFSIILADSGQKQLIFRAPVNYDKSVFRILLEEKEIEVRPEILSDYINKAMLISAAVGKKTLLEPDQFFVWKNVIELYGSELPLVEWLEIFTSPLGELAAWLCPGKEECRNDNIVSGRFSKETGRDRRSIDLDAGYGAKSSKGRSNQILLNFA